jgi:GcrA cell cycle regulator
MFAIKKPTDPTPHQEPTVPLGQRKTMETLMANDCRWPIGDPQVADFHFCGGRKVDGHPYCDVHLRRASQPTRPRAVAYPNLVS